MESSKHGLITATQEVESIDEDAIESFIRTVSKEMRVNFGGDNLFLKESSFSHIIDTAEATLKNLSVLMSIIRSNRYSNMNTTYKTFEKQICFKDDVWNVQETFLKLSFYFWLIASVYNKRPRGQKLIISKEDMPDLVYESFARRIPNIKTYNKVSDILSSHGMQPEERKLKNKLWGKLMEKKEEVKSKFLYG